MSRSPIVSVVMPTYRRSDLMRRAVRSVMAQTFSDFELIVVDDNGEGHPQQLATQQHLNDEFDDVRIRYIVNAGAHGGSGARNTGIREAHGDYIGFIDDDEDWLPAKLQKQIELFEVSSSSVGVIHTGFYDWKSDGRVRHAHPKMEGWIFERLLAKTGGRAPKLSTILCRREVFDHAGCFDTELPAREDYDLYLRIARNFQFLSLDEPLANKRADAEQRLTSNPENFVKGFEGIYRKFGTEFRARPHTHSVYLLRYSEALVKAGHRDEALNRYFQAARLWPLNPRLITYGFKLLRG